MNRTEHLFECLSEECAEVIQAAAKVNRFAIDGRYPDGRGNVEAVVAELNDVLAIVEMLHAVGVDLSKVGDREQIEAKKIKVMEMMLLATKRNALFLDERDKKLSPEKHARLKLERPKLNESQIRDLVRAAANAEAWFTHQECIDNESLNYEAYQVADELRGALKAVEDNAPELLECNGVGDQRQ